MEIYIRRFRRLPQIKNNKKESINRDAQGKQDILKSA